MTDLNKLSLAEARDALRKGETTSTALTEACLKAIDGAGALNAFVRPGRDHGHCVHVADKGAGIALDQGEETLAHGLAEFGAQAFR